MGSSNYMYTPAIVGQVRYITQWFKEWSEMQRTDFLPILVQTFDNKAYVNGLVTNMDSMCSLEDRPPSLFQCRIKLFKEWSQGWNQNEKDQLINELKSLDEDFINKYTEETNSGIKEVLKSENVVVENGTAEIEGLN